MRQQLRSTLRRLKRRARAGNRCSDLSTSASLQALTVAALALPGLAPMPGVAAEGEEASFQYGHYQEGGGAGSHFRETGKSIQVDTIQASAGARLLDRLLFRFNYQEDTWSGATPVAAAPAGALRLNDSVAGASPFWDMPQINTFDPKKGIAVYRDFAKDLRLETDETVEVMAYASPEIRRQGDFRLGYEWDEAAIDGGAGVSIENDFDVWFANLGGRMDFNQKRTTVTLGATYTNSSIDAQRFAYSVVGSNPPEPPKVEGIRRDESVGLGLVQVLDQNSVLQANIGYTNSSGYLSNPYKQSLFFATVEGRRFNSPDPKTGLYKSAAIAEFDNRPNVRDQFNFNTRYVRYFNALDAALHLDYRFYHDGWGINAHTFEAAWGQPLGKGWMVRPAVRYYSQGAAHFYSAYYVLDTTLDYPEYIRTVVDGDTSGLGLPAHWSSDYRLSGYGALSGGITVSKQFARGILLQGGLEYYTHAGSMKMGGGGEGGFADFNYYLLNLGLKVDLSAPAPLTTDADEHAGHMGHGHHVGHPHSAFPAGVMFAHMLDEPDDVMVAYRYMWSLQSGNMMHGSHSVPDSDVIENGCFSVPCTTVPREMNMHMHMIDLMYAPTSWLNLMVMPTFMNMSMSLRQLEDAPPSSGGGHHHGSGERPMASGGIGDTGFYAMARLFDQYQQHMHLTLGFSAPTGDVNQRVSGQYFTHYMMQLGSGTWDFRPSFTYTGFADRFSWGAQFNGILRPDDRNVSGYKLGDMWQSTAWGSVQLYDWLSANVRGAYTRQFRSVGHYSAMKGGSFNSGPMDFTQNYGGRYWDVGFGLNVDIKQGVLRGNSLSVEWLQPVEVNVNGYQLKPNGMLSATWSLEF